MRIAVLDDYQGVALEMADWSRVKRAHEVTVFRKAFASQDEAARSLADCEIICAMRERTPFPRAMFERLPRLKLLVTTGMVNAAIDLEAAAAKGVVVCGTPSPGHAPAELSFALLLGLARQLHVEHQNVREGRWQTTVGDAIHGRVLGILGLGRLGALMANYARAFGMQVIAWSQNLTDARASECNAKRVDKTELFRTADYVAVHLKLSERTKGLVGAPEFGLMKKPAYLINTSRGPIVKEEDLISALNEGRIAGAALDVFDVEPLPADHPLRKAPRVLLTPHIGYVSGENYKVFYGGTVEAIEAWLAGKPIRRLGA
jgi:phosphoglycerate dehydrogenase-like enzyme